MQNPNFQRFEALEERQESVETLPLMQPKSTMRLIEAIKRKMYLTCFPFPSTKEPINEFDFTSENSWNRI